MVMFQNCLIKKMVFNKQSYSEKKKQLELKTAAYLG